MHQKKCAAKNAGKSAKKLRQASTGVGATVATK